MRKGVVIGLMVFLLSVTLPVSAFGQYEQSYKLYLDLGIKTLKEGDCKRALLYFETAHNIDTSKKEPLRYIRYIESLKIKKKRPVKKEEKIYVRHVKKYKKRALVPKKRKKVVFEEKERIYAPRIRAKRKPRLMSLRRI